ncbi:DUF4817 domain-containing protein [Trichonephila clavipes]|nr:DUF4817 domain-containing protein [Trichonephila clavipes]
MARVRWKGWRGVFVFQHVSVNMLLWRQQHALAVEVYFSNGGSVVALQRAFRRNIDIPTRGHAPHQKCVLIRMDAFRATENVSKERNELPKTLKLLKL